MHLGFSLDPKKTTKKTVKILLVIVISVVVCCLTAYFVMGAVKVNMHASEAFELWSCCKVRIIVKVSCKLVGETD